MRLCCILAIASLTATPVLAQQEELKSGSPKLVISERAIARGMAAAPPAPAMQSSRDSLKNGALIGAVIGSAALAITGGVVCNLLREPADPPCWKSMLPVAAIGAGIGAAAGAGLDALFVRSPQPAVDWRR